MSENRHRQPSNRDVHAFKSAFFALRHLVWTYKLSDDEEENYIESMRRLEGWIRELDPEWCEERGM